MLKLATLRRRITEGAYDVDPRAVAEAILLRLGALRRDAPAIEGPEPLSPGDAQSRGGFGATRRAG